MRGVKLIIFTVFGFTSAFAQDSLILKNGDRIVGEIKKMDKGVLTIETDYSKSDFTVKWNEIQKIYSNTDFLLTFSDGGRIFGTIESTDSATIVIRERSGLPYTYSLSDLAVMKPISQKFWDKFHASLSIGYSITKAQNLRQFSSRSSVNYITEYWGSDASFNNINSSQDSLADIQRTDGGINFNYFLPKDWYIPVSATFLSNTEQLIDLRLLTKVGIGKYVIHNTRAYWGFSIGANNNYENFSDDTRDNNSWESFMGTEVNLFDIGDLNLLTRAVVYPSMTEKRRVRADFNFDVKYDLPLDFYIQMGLTVNADNKPAENAPQTDYVFQTTFGWSLN